MVLRRAKQPQPPHPAPDYGLALEEARRRLDSQLGVIDACRGRATTLLGVAGLIGTFVGGLSAVDAGAEMTCALWVAAGAFAVSVVAGLFVLVPWKFHASMEASELVNWADKGHTRHVQERDLALRVDNQVRQNEDKAERLHRAVFIVVLAVAIEFAALTHQLIRST